MRVTSSSERGNRLSEAGTGDHMVVPRRTLHAATAIKPTRLVVGITQELLDGVEVERPPYERH